MGVHGFERAEITVQELADHFAEPGIILREARGIDRVAASLESEREELDLGAFAAAINAFDGDEFSGRGHFFYDDRGTDSGRKPV